VVFTQLNVLERQLVMTPLARAAAGGTLFFDHGDPEMVSWLNSRRGD
jgi:hypothetical protein